jgi:hypothetical protein
MVKNILFVLGLFFLLVSCETTPPVSPDITPTGNIVLNINLDNTSSMLAATKVVLLEDFANVSCIPCVESNRIIERLTNNSYGRNKLVAVKFPTNFPSPNDPFYLSNKEVCDTRMTYYTIIAAPTSIFDGTTRFLSLNDTASVKAAIDAKLAVIPRFGIDVSGNLEQSGDYVFTVTISLIDTIGINLNDLVIHTAITETDIEYDTPPGSNGETKFYDVIRLMLPSISGEPLRNLINNGELSYEFNDALLASWNLNKINAVIYIQNNTTKEVYQTGSTF